MSTRFLRALEIVVSVLVVISAAILALSRFGLIPQEYSNPALATVIVGIIVEGAWRAVGQGVWRHAIVKRLIQNALDNASTEMRELSASEIRASLMRSKGRCRKVLAVAYSSTNMLSDPDRGIRLEKWQGSAGKAWGHAKAVVADLTLRPQEGGPDWSMTADLVELTRDIKSVLSYPVFLPEKGSSLYGIMNFDAQVGIAGAFASQAGLRLADKHAKAISAITQATM